MDREDENFAAMRTWETLLASSIVQRRVWCALSTLDDRFGAPVRTWIKSVERRLGGKLVAHKLALEEPEEDEFLLLHIWSTIAINHFSAIMEEAAAHTRFDWRYRVRTGNGSLLSTSSAYSDTPMRAD